LFFISGEVSLWCLLWEAYERHEKAVSDASIEEIAAGRRAKSLLHTCRHALQIEIHAPRFLFLIRLAQESKAVLLIKMDDLRLYMKIPPSPLYQRGVRGDFHASLWPQAMGVI
jgi:hypothetical protein